ncbi:MAG: phosphorylase [Betaproteobacteria bacterium]|nr:phosphorylase [Betaproteobacteria bacterium]
MIKNGHQGSIWGQVGKATDAALASGALVAIRTTAATVADGGVEFVVREVSSLLEKFDAQAKAAPQRNPFLPYEEALYLGHLSPTHLALLNKFPVMGRHFLVISESFVHQETLLLPEDFIALARALGESDALAFYNAGRAAGASQRHRHLQVVPLPFEGASHGTPIDPALAAQQGKVGTDIADLGYRHALGWLQLETSPDSCGLAMHALYRRLIGLLGITSVATAEGDRQSSAYNLIATRSWMLIVPRTREHFASISINALGFAGSLFVRNDAERELVRRVGPRALLAAVTR